MVPYSCMTWTSAHCRMTDATPHHSVGQLVRLTGHHTYRSLGLRPIGIIVDVSNYSGLFLALVLTVSEDGVSTARWFSAEEITAVLS